MSRRWPSSSLHGGETSVQLVMTITKHLQQTSRPSGLPPPFGDVNWRCEDFVREDQLAAVGQDGMARLGRTMKLAAGWQVSATHCILANASPTNASPRLPLPAARRRARTNRACRTSAKIHRDDDNRQPTSTELFRPRTGRRLISTLSAAGAKIRFDALRRSRRRITGSKSMRVGDSACNCRRD